MPKAYVETTCIVSSAVSRQASPQRSGRWQRGAKRSVEIKRKAPVRIRGQLQVER
jgi:hypothetical protein